MKSLFYWVVAATLMVGCASSPQVIETPVPQRPAGQEDMVGFAAPKIENVRIGIIGLGMRGPGAVDRFMYIDGAEVVALCDIDSVRVALCQQMLRENGFPEIDAAYWGTEDAWKQLCDREDIDLVYIATDWKHHAEMGLYAMEHGKHVAIEVPAAMNMEEIWALINTSERTRKHCMQLENCVYDFFEMNTLHMAQQGLFGEVLHVEGSYIHDLRDFWSQYWHNWRLEYNLEHRGDVYPTHGMGPACQLLDMHRGDRMTTLVAMDTKSVMGPEYVAEKMGVEDCDFQNGDHTMTMIRTANGKTIHIQHDVMTPRPYSRMYQLTGTRGFANKYPFEGYAFEPAQLGENEIPDHENLSAHGFLSAEQHAALVEKYQHPIVREIGEIARKVGGHGGMDFIMDYRLIYCLHHGLPLDMDVYDLAEWCCLGPLSSLSIEHNSAPVAVPDFTRGGWQKIRGFRHAFAE